jgi:hypothetical protein
MNFSEKNKYIYIAVPKTGSTSVNRFLKNNDKSFSKNILVPASGISVKVETHIAYKDIAAIIGSSIDNYVTFAFLRDPYETLFSYYRYIIRPKEGRTQYRLKDMIVRNVSWLLGFKIWALIFPFKPSADFILNEKGNIGVKYLGRTEYLNSDFAEICKLENFDFLESIETMERRNSTKPKDFAHHLSDSWFKKLMDMRLKKDIDIYNKIRDKMYIRS